MEQQSTGCKSLLNVLSKSDVYVSCLVVRRLPWPHWQPTTAYIHVHVVRITTKISLSIYFNWTTRRILSRIYRSLLLDGKSLIWVTFAVTGHHSDNVMTMFHVYWPAVFGSFVQLLVSTLTVFWLCHLNWNNNCNDDWDSCVLINYFLFIGVLVARCTLITCYQCLMSQMWWLCTVCIMFSFIYVFAY